MSKALSKSKPARRLKKIFLVDDHPVFRGGLAELLKREGDFTICGEADNALDALAAIERLKPDLALVDIGLPGKSGLELIKDLQSACRDTDVLVVSMYDETLYAERVLRAGGRGYIMKAAGPDKILQAVRQVLDGDVFVSAKVSNRIVEGVSGRRSKEATPISQLTDREFEVLQLIGRGNDNHAIAKRLHLSVKTVDAHRGHIKEKLAFKNGTELISYATRWAEMQGATEA
jgi:DNA-binding NarL/FixJ family response regulator